MSLLRKLRQTRVTALAGIALLCVGTGALAGCGGSSSSTSQTSTQRAQPTAAGNPDVGTAKVQTQTKQPAYVNPTTGGGHASATTGGSHAPATTGGSAATGGKQQAAPSGSRTSPDKVTPSQAVKVQKARPTPGASKDDNNVRSAATNPCTLVSVSEAQEITGTSIA